MRNSLSLEGLSGYVARQLNQFFPDGRTVRSLAIKKLTPAALQRLETCMAACARKYFFRDGRPWFDHLHSDQYAMFLYLLARTSAEDGSAKGRELATKLFLLNKALHAADVYFEIQMPDIFLFAHPVGTVLGRATYGNYFVAMQNCTVGNVDNRYPQFGEKVVLCSGSMVLGACELGAGVCVGAGSLLVEARVPAYRTVIGRGKEIRILPGRTEKWRTYFQA